jgi:hypothetical protein
MTALPPSPFFNSGASVALTPGEAAADVSSQAPAAAVGILPDRKARRAYVTQKKRAKRRGIAWEFINFDQWWGVWQRSGHWAERGNKDGNSFVMCRYGDVGPYSVDNVFIATCRENSSNQPQKKSGLPMGVVRTYHRPSAFTAYRRVKRKRVYIGSFPTVEQARAAYLRSWGEQP